MNREQALALLNEHCPGDGSWRTHCLQVSAAARYLAELISQRGYPIDVEQAGVLGLLHDLGRCREHTLRHGIEGYLLVRAVGYGEDGRICLLHILKGRTLDQAVKLGMLTPEEQEQLEGQGRSSSELSLEEKTAILADALMSDTGLAHIEEKYANARRRYGAQLHHGDDEAWVKGVAAEIAPMLGRAPYDALKGLGDDVL